jgi:TQO small subunit DoxD
MATETYSGGMTPDTTTVKPASKLVLAAARVVVGYMWYEQTLWKQPPSWGGLRFWVEQSGRYATPWYRSFVNGVVLPHFGLFAPQVWFGETIIAVSLVFGLFGRLGGILCFLMGINLYLANSRIPGEWSWSYVFIALLGAVFAATRAGRCFGIDQLLVPRLQRLLESHPKLGGLLLALT